MGAASSIAFSPQKEKSAGQDQYDDEEYEEALCTDRSYGPILPAAPSPTVRGTISKIMTEVMRQKSTTDHLHEPSAFCNEQMFSARETFVQDGKERLGFARFIKEGCWMDDVCRNVNFKSTHALLLPKDEGDVTDVEETRVLLDFFVPAESCKLVRKNLIGSFEEESGKSTSGKSSGYSGKSSSTPATSDKSTFSTTLSTLQPIHESTLTSLVDVPVLTMRPSARVRRGSRDFDADSATSTVIEPGGLTAEDFQDDYVRVRHLRAERDSDKYSCSRNAAAQHSGNNSFSRAQMLSVLFTVLYPLYVSQEGRQDSPGAEEQKSFCFVNSDGQCRCPRPCDESDAASEDARIAQELLLSTAAYFDEYKMLHALEQGRWLDRVPRAVDRCVLGISVCCALGRTPKGRRFPILYANQALQTQTGYSLEQLQGGTFALLHGPLTEPEQLRRISSALRDKEAVKVAITNYRRNSQAYVNMLMLKPVLAADGEELFVLGISFDVSRRGASLSELQQAESLLALLPLILATNGRPKTPWIEHTHTHNDPSPPPAKDSFTPAPPTNDPNSIF
jgi:PAS domain S-box-containing protein